MVGEPGERSLQDADGGGGGLVGADFDVGDAGVVVDDGVQDRGADVGFVVGVSGAGAFGGDLAVAVALFLADVAADDICRYTRPARIG
jgi:hypothetical protein